MKTYLSQNSFKTLSVSLFLLAGVFIWTGVKHHRGIPVHVTIAGTPDHGKYVTQMSLSIDGKVVLPPTKTQKIDKQFNLTVGTHRAVLNVWNNKGEVKNHDYFLVVADQGVKK